jgi:hypothetical protein
MGAAALRHDGEQPVRVGVRDAECVVAASADAPRKDLPGLNPYSDALAATQSRRLLISRSGDAGSFGAAEQSPVPGISKLTVA